MITILNDIQAVTGNTLIVPFSLDTSKLKDEPLNVEVFGIIGQTVTALPKGLVSCVLSGGTEQAMDKIQPAFFKNAFVVRVNLSTYALDGLYIRVYNRFIAWTTPKINVSRLMDMDFHTAPKELAFRPKVIKVNDNVQCTYNRTICALTKDKFNIQIFISNNANSRSPIWEDVTRAYLNNETLVFTNVDKDDDKPWSVSVRYKIGKTIGDSTVQISDIALLVL